MTLPSSFFRVLPFLFTFLLTLAFPPTFGQLHVRTSPPAGALVVRQRGTQEGEYANISAAVAALGSGVAVKTIFIYPGIYNESVYIDYEGPLTIQGYTQNPLNYSSNQVIITASTPANTVGNDDSSGTLRVHKDNFSLYNVNVMNTWGNASHHLQAIAVSAFGSQQGYYGCHFSGYQDTLLAESGTQVYAGSLISGAVDFIFGQTAVAWFENSVIQSVGNGSITASGRSSADSLSWYVFNKCRIVPAGSHVASYLGRPWSDYARVTFQQSVLRSHIRPRGWNFWKKSDPRTDYVSFLEFANTGPGANTTLRAEFSSNATAPLQMSKILGSTSSLWVDSGYLA